MAVIDISVPTSPQVVGEVGMIDRVREIVVVGDHAYVANSGAGLHVIDISVPENPTIIGSGVTTGDAAGVAFAGDCVYVANSDTGLLIAKRQCDESVGIEDDPEDPSTDEEVASPGIMLGVHPNPFNPCTQVSFTIDHSQHVELCIFDVTGKRIAILADRLFETGKHSLDWEGKDLKGRAVASGTYLLRMVNDEGVSMEKMMLIR